MQSIKEIIVKQEDIDQLGHVNYMKYISYLEEGIIDWYEKAGVPFQVLQKENLGMVVIKFDVSYQKEARLGDTLKIITTPVHIGTKSFTFKQDIYNQKDVHITESNKIFVMFNTATRKSVPVIEQISRNFINELGM